MTNKDLAKARALGQTIASWTLCALQFTFSILHTHAPWAYRVDGRTSTGVVAYINSLGPVWTILFGASGLVLGVACSLRKLQWVGHAACGSIFAGFMCALFVSAIFNSPAGPFTYPTLALFVTFAHGVMVYSYSSGGER